MSIKGSVSEHKKINFTLVLWAFENSIFQQHFFMKANSRLILTLNFISRVWPIKCC